MNCRVKIMMTGLVVSYLKYIAHFSLNSMHIPRIKLNDLHETLKLWEWWRSKNSTPYTLPCTSNNSRAYKSCI